MAVTLDRPYDDVVPAVREALATQGFGVLTEIDVRATLKTKLDVDVPAQIILGACRPELAHRALDATPSLGALLPCNVVVRSHPQGGSEIIAADPNAMLGLADAADIAPIAGEAAQRIQRALHAAADA